MQFRNQIGEANSTFSITLFTNAIKGSDRGSNSYFFELLYTQIHFRGSNSFYFLLLYSQMQSQNQIGEATPFFLITIYTNAIAESDRGSNSYFF